MIYGLSGASSSGKSTLGHHVAEYLDITFLPTSITECAKKHGFDAVGRLTLEQRMKLQRHLLDDHIEALQKSKHPVITDRTPIDMAAYAACEFDMHSHERASREVLVEMESYIGDCLRVATDHYDHIFMLSRLKIYQAAETRPSDNPAYHRHCELTMKGLLLDLPNANYTVLLGTNLDFRIETTATMIADRLNAREAERKTMRVN